MKAKKVGYYEGDYTDQISETEIISDIENDINALYDPSHKIFYGTTPPEVYTLLAARITKPEKKITDPFMIKIKDIAVPVTVNKSPIIAPQDCTLLVKCSDISNLFLKKLDCINIPYILDVPTIEDEDESKYIPLFRFLLITLKTSLNIWVKFIQEYPRELDHPGIVLIEKSTITKKDLKLIEKLNISDRTLLLTNHHHVFRNISVYNIKPTIPKGVLRVNGNTITISHFKGPQDISKMYEMANIVDEINRISTGNVSGRNALLSFPKQ